MPSHFVGFSWQTDSSQMKGTTVSASSVSLTSAEKSALSYAATVGAVSFLPVGFPTLRSCFQVLAYKPLPATLFYLPELGIKLFEHYFHFSGEGCCLQSHRSLPIWQTYFVPCCPSFTTQIVPIFSCSCSLSKTHFFHNADGNMLPVNNQAGEELCLGS